MAIMTSSPLQTTVVKNEALAGWVVDLHQVVKTYKGTAGTFTALKGIDLQVEAGAFVSIIGKSGRGNPRSST
jgi:predicted ABC-type transport system involved in lysophospholipase L1 biosynthesis ATPase subunit